MPKKTYTVVVDVTSAIGTQSFTVEANSPDEARRLVDSGDIECDNEELHVETVSPVEEWEVFEDGKKTPKARN